jgi:hypothetical protein
MPANLPPQYYEAEKRYRLAKGPEEKVEALQAMLSIMPRHKGTDKLHAELRRKIAKFSGEMERRYGGGKRGSPYHLRREGAGQVVLVGLCNVGKSSLLLKVTEASPEIADYPFTTQTLTPGMMRFEDIQIQLVDTPPLASPVAQPWLTNVFRNADLLLLVIDLGKEPLEQAGSIIEELRKRGIKPRRNKGGGETAPGEVGKEALIVGNKNDVEDSNQNYERLVSQYGAKFPIISVSAQKRTGLEELKREIYAALGVIRVYTKAPGKKLELREPVVLKKGSTIAEAAESVHKDLRSRLKYALVWGSGKYEGQRVGREHVLKDGDIIELHA